MKQSTLILNDGAKINGKSFGADVVAAGEIVFNTGMVGYPEILTDPSYQGQILVLTYPLIGNYGIPADERDEHGLLKFFESDNIHIRGLIISDYSFDYSHWNAVKSLDQWLKEHNIPAIYAVDTRELTKKLREHGVMLGCIEMGSTPRKGSNPLATTITDPNTTNLVAEVSIKEPITYSNNIHQSKVGGFVKKIILVDCGVKNNIIRCLLARSGAVPPASWRGVGGRVVKGGYLLEIKRVPWDYDFTEKDYDGVLISNGPGDPKQCVATINNIKKAMQKNRPIFGICLGNQLLALAAGADTYKLKYGHRGQNQPCVEVGTKRCYITSQNHGYAVNEKTLPPDWEPWFINANDKTNEGIRHKTKPFRSVQFHPEASPGPVDTEWLFDEFIKSVNNE